MLCSHWILELIVSGCHALRLCEGRDSTDIRHALRKASERATLNFKWSEALGADIADNLDPATGESYYSVCI